VTPPRPPRVFAALAIGAVLLLSGCGGNHNVLNPESPPERRITHLFWIVMTGSWIGLGITAVFLFLGWARRNREGLPGGGGDMAGGVLVVALGVAVPIVVLSVLFWYSDLRVIGTTAAPAASSTSRTIEVIGHQWFWEVRYPGSKAVTANEIHIPTRTRINLVATTADVIHSFRVPELNRKIDMIPGKRNHILLYADKPGVYRGQCSEFCGFQHANMAMFVFAQPRAAFKRWLAHMAAPATSAGTGAATRGRAIFLSQSCAGCHTIRGTQARGRVGPDLTHLQTRTTLAAGTIPNTKGYLAEWVADPQHVKPGNKMPQVPLQGQEFQDLIAYLESLK
jgi:cytochrome c oxidase subunit 2